MLSTLYRAETCLRNNMSSFTVEDEVACTNILKTETGTGTNAETETETEQVIAVQKWDEMDLRDDLLRGIYAYGFEEPSDIQKKAVVPMTQKRDILAQAHSGGGKTGTFSIGSLQQIDTSQSCTQSLILAPTHELVRQIANVIINLAAHMDNVVVKTLVGGTPIRADIDSLEATPPHVVVGSVGRVFDMLYKRHLDISKLKVFVLDEADEMLSRGFGEQIQEMFRHYVPVKSQVAFFSATMPDEMVTLCNRILQNPVRIRVKAEELSLKAIEQYYVALPNDDMKFDTIKDLFSVINVTQCIIYCNSVRRVEHLAHAMEKDGHSVHCIHSSMDKAHRQEVLDKFRSGGIRVLISSDVTARGIDVQQVGVVVNFDIPRNVHTYLHRIGRSGRWGRKGCAINLVTRRDIQDMRQIEQFYSITIQELPANFSYST